MRRSKIGDAELVRARETIDQYVRSKGPSANRTRRLTMFSNQFRQARQVTGRFAKADLGSIRGPEAKETTIAFRTH